MQTKEEREKSKVEEREYVEQGDVASSQHSRLYWQCRRGMLELDLVLQAYLDHHYHRATAEEQQAFEALLNYPDPLLLEYVMGYTVPSDPQLAHVVACLRADPTA